MELTQKDEELIALLKGNAREPVASLARRLGVSRTTVQDRLRRLEEAGVIAGYGVRLAEEGNRAGIRAYVEISVEPRRTHDVTRELLRLPQLETLHSVSGPFDFVAQVRTETPERMDRLLDHMGQIPGVTRTASAVILTTKLDRR